MPPAILLEEIPAEEELQEFVQRGRQSIADSLHGKDDRLVVVCGPCSIHNVESAHEYGDLLKAEAEKHKEDLILVMRAYFEKPRTVDGWKGLINDPGLDESFQINRGLRLARELLHDLTKKRVLLACEFLDNIIPQYIADFVSWVAIGARTSESQIHREFASGCSMPVGFKNGTSGRIDVAVDACRAAAKSHWFLSVTKQGTSAILQTQGNPDGHVILRGGFQPNYDEDSVAGAVKELEAKGVTPRVMVDCSHGNSGKDYRRQRHVAADLCCQISQGPDRIFGVMIESHLREGRQDLVPGVAPDPGVSVTDSCVGWAETVDLLDQFASAARARRG
jgi:3-deoxy-7-phosphoheptulonate synthase